MIFATLYIVVQGWPLAPNYYPVSACCFLNEKSWLSKALRAENLTEL